MKNTITLKAERKARRSCLLAGIRLLVIGILTVSPAFSADTAIDRSSTKRWPKTLVRALQDKLSGMGLDPGPADGLYGPRTAAAIRDFQVSNGLEPDGEINDELLNLLGL